MAHNNRDNLLNNALRAWQEALKSNGTPEQRGLYDAIIRERPLALTAGGRTVLKMLSYDAMKQFSNEESGIVMLSATWCPSCSRAKAHFETIEDGPPVHCLDVDTLEDDESLSDLGAGFVNDFGNMVTYYPTVLFLYRPASGRPHLKKVDLQETDIASVQDEYSKWLKEKESATA